MRAKPVLLLVALLLVGGWLFLNSRARAFNWSTDLAATRQEALAAGKPLLLDLSAQWCGPCQDMKATTLTDPSVVQALKDYVVVSVDVDAYPEIAGQLHVNSIPSFFVVDAKSGKVLKQTRRGAMSPQDFLAWLKSAADPAISETLAPMSGRRQPPRNWPLSFPAERALSRTMPLGNNGPMLWRRIILVMALVAWPAGGALAQEHVRAELLADTSAIAAGMPFRIGVRLTIDPQWHVYWENPGTAGLPTRVKFTLPAGFRAGPLQYPTPWRFDQPGGITAFGYENSVLLLAQITPPADLAANFRGTIKAEVSWLACADVCLAGQAALEMSLPAGPVPTPANTALFDAARAQLPVEVSASPDVKTIDHGGEGRARWLRLTWKQAVPEAIQFLPAALDAYNIGGVQVQSEHGQTLISFQLEPLAGRHPPATNLDVVVGYTSQGGNHRGVRCAVALPAMNSSGK